MYFVNRVQTRRVDRPGHAGENRTRDDTAGNRVAMVRSIAVTSLQASGNMVMRSVLSLSSALAVLVSAGSPTLADDWPQWLGPNRDTVWRETGIL